MQNDAIRVRGARVHNLKGIDVDVPLGKLSVFCGVSGSGKSSLAFDTLYVEGQRRYVECFSPYVRQFLERLERPAADSIEPIPPALAVRQNSLGRSGKATVASVTEIYETLRLLYARVGRIICPGCGRRIARDTVESAAASVGDVAEGVRFQVAFPLRFESESGRARAEELALQEREGFSRAIVGNRTLPLSQAAAVELEQQPEAWIVVDRLVAGRTSEERLRESLETAFREGDGRTVLLVERGEGSPPAAGSEDFGQGATEPAIALVASIDDRSWHVHRLSERLVCVDCEREFLPPEPRLFSFNSPLGACPRCEGFGRVPAISWERLVPDPSKSLREGAIPAWTTPEFRHELDELLELAGDYGLPVDLPFAELGDEHRRLILEGVPERDFGGMVGFFRWLERHRYRREVRSVLKRWRAWQTCPTCEGGRLRPEALAVHLPGGPHIADFCRLTVEKAQALVRGLEERFTEHERAVSAMVLRELLARLDALDEVGLPYLTLDRRIGTLSGGEARRVKLAATLGCALSGALYVLDEPSAGLHPRDSRRVIEVIERLRDAGNTVVVVEHEDEFVLAADHIVEIGPGAGRSGGEVVFAGTPEALIADPQSLTGAYLSGRRRVEGRKVEGRNGRSSVGMLTLAGARGHNLKDITVEFPLGVLCVVTGVSGAGKSTLVEQTLYPAVCRALGRSSDGRPHALYDELTGAEALDDVVLCDPAPVGRTPRSSPVTYLKAFDEIRRVFAAAEDARLRGFDARQFSFNASGGGRCAKCKGSGAVEVDMQFRADIAIMCPECRGSRYRRDVLEVKYRGLSIAEVLDMTVAEAFTFFRTHAKLQKRLRFLKDVGLEYLPLGQPATTLSGGESQRLKLASFLAAGSAARTLFLIDEPTT
ncbi:MAG: excinuclease ABC subunit UvrA, partial [Planctomycetes bacterium]|nr:excinuclease ABC subunit UvrA [Planctomycetota bacterium]